jgi:small subunit ribosomal protein S20
MANTRKSTKRARQSDDRKARNLTVRSASRTVLRAAIEAVRGKDAAKAKEAYQAAIKGLSKAASKGALPKGRASRKISRLTLMAKKIFPDLLGTTTKGK